MQIFIVHTKLTYIASYMVLNFSGKVPVRKSIPNTLFPMV
jgi:hypothetical protein